MSNPFRDSVERGKKLLKNVKATKELTLTLGIPTEDGEYEVIAHDCFIKRFSARDYEEYYALLADDKCSRYTASVICSCVNDKGEKILQEDDIPLLEDSFNATECIRVFGEIQNHSLITKDVANAKKL
jgi:hypothetical protein